MVLTTHGILYSIEVVVDVLAKGQTIDQRFSLLKTIKANLEQLLTINYLLLINSG